MPRRRLFPLPLLLAACAPAAAGPLDHAPEPHTDSVSTVLGELPRTRAERSGYTETSSHADVLRFLDSLRALDARAHIAPTVHVGSIGTTTEGRDIPFVIASRPLVTTPEEARRLGRPIVYVQGNIHGGEVEGKEALQALLRDLVVDARANALDSLVLIAVPIYNADGNERWGPQQRNRPEQNGPERVGQRANAQGLDLNRDYVKAEAPETRASLAMFNRWDPDVFVDLHTTNGSYHGYALTYSPSLSPAAGPANALTRDRLLPELRRRTRQRHGFETFDYGNFSLRYGADVNTDTLKEGWYTYDHRPRFGTNYFGLRNGVSILAEAYSHDPFRRRVEATRAFVGEILSLVAERADEVLAATRAPDPVAGRRLALRGALTRTPYLGEVIAEDLERVDSSVVAEAGMHPGLRRTGRFRTLRIPVYDRFDATLERSVPAAYALGPEQGEVVELLRLHGVRVQRLEQPRTVRARAFVVDSVARAPRPFQGHHEVSLQGRWTETQRDLPAGSFWIPADQPLGRLAAVLLEPESDDGLTTWNAFDAWLAAEREHPVLRVLGPAGG